MNLKFAEKLFARIADAIRKPRFMADSSQYRRHCIGAYTYGAPKIYQWDDSTRLSIGKHCSIAKDVSILLGGEHRTDWVTTYPFNKFFREVDGITGYPHSKGDVSIGNDVWIGMGATILSGVTIGDGAVIASHSLVTRDVPPYAIAGGNPARVIRSRFPVDVVRKLQVIAWWDWPIEKIEEGVPLLMHNDIDAFIRWSDECSIAR
ncbi:acetyltransferase [Ferrigenium kumadai]|uniref:Acetyltransferase n=1 Tax=Ferrigenium kumadai TaxID=1682490 RepID=A0AAN1T172_9PROT|nr:CatB-related O-acetyltransferase [Ferrigenium kumadai]BBJ00397.1 acetyltransferase [Ferrigenium kumadai]